MGVSQLFSDFFALSELHAEAPSDDQEEEDQGDEKSEGGQDEKEGGEDDDEGEGDNDGGDDEDEGEEEEEEEEEEPEDPKPRLEEECARSAQCAPLKHHYDECAERVQQQHENPNHKGPKEDCVEELCSFWFLSLGSSFNKETLPSILQTTKPAPTIRPKPIYLDKRPDGPPTVDNFGAATEAKSARDLPSVPSWNRSPQPHVKEQTPLFIGFTRNWRILQQVVVSYIVAGWPPEDIYVVDNSGTMFSNKENRLSLQNPSYLNYERLTEVLRINVITTPTLLTFAQLQNFYLFTALERGWSHFWWSHQDVVAVAMEDDTKQPYKSLYMKAVDILRQIKDDDKVAMRWFSYDRLELVRTQSLVDVGGWDTFIPFYMVDCDMHERLWMNNYTIEDVDAGGVWDVDSTFDDLSTLYARGDNTPRRSSNQSEPQLNSPQYKDLLSKLDILTHVKNSREGGRNMWQSRQSGGQGDPFYRDAEGFERAIRQTMDFGKDMFYEKWGRRECDLREAGMVQTDAWRVVKDWESPEVQRKLKEERKKAGKA